MARISFKADKEAESVGGGGGDFSAAPRGFYWVQITEASDGRRTSAEAKNPDVPMTNFTLEIADEDERGALGKKLWHTVVWIPRGNEDKAKPGHGMAVHFLHATKMPFDGEFDFDEQQFLEEQHCMLRVLLEVDTYINSKGYENEKNFIREIYSENHPEPKELPEPPKKKAKAATRAASPAGAGKDLEDVPF